MKARNSIMLLGAGVGCVILMVLVLSWTSPGKAEAQHLRPLTDEWTVKCYAGSEIIIDTAFYGPPITENGMLVIDTGARSVRYVCAGNCVITHKRKGPLPQ